MSDFSMPDFSMPSLRMADLSVPDIVMPDSTLPDPALPALLQPDMPPDLDRLDGIGAPMPTSTQEIAGEPIAMPDDPLQDPQDSDDNPAQILVDSPDEQQLPEGLAYDALYTTDGLTTRERHLGMLLLGLEGEVGGVGGMEQ